MRIDRMSTLSEDLTELLMENGCSVTKKGIRALVKLIADRDEHTVQRIIKDSERTLQTLQHDPYFGTNIREDSQL